MSVYATINVNGKEIRLTGEWRGEKDPGWNDLHSEAQHNVVTVETDEGEQEFDFWGSIINPTLETEYDLLNAFNTICDEALYAMWDQYDEIIYDMDYSEGKELEAKLRESADKLESIGIDDEICEQIVNNEDWQ